jgi:hypothetical protein
MTEKGREPPSEPGTKRMICTTSVEIGAGSAGDAGQLGRCRGSPDRMVPGLPPPSRARSRRTGSTLRRRSDASRLAGAAGVLQMREPRNRYGRDRDEAASGHLTATHPEFPPVLGLRGGDGLPLHVGNRMGTATGQRFPVRPGQAPAVSPVEGQGCSPLFCRRARASATARTGRG